MANSVEHSWVHQIRNRRNELYQKQGNVFFEGAVIYSYGYHFAMAALVTNKKGQRAVIISEARYSVTTAGHQSAVRRAIPDDLPTFFVPSVASNRYSQAPEYPHWNKEEMRAAFDSYISEAREFVIKAKKATKYGPGHLDSARILLGQAEKLCRFFDLRWKIPTFEDIGPDSKQTQQIEEKAKLAAKREAKIRKEREIQRIEAQRIDREKAQVSLSHWLTGGSIYLPNIVQRDEEGSAYIRTVGDTVQTSQGAEVPLAHAIRAFRFAKLCRQTGKAFAANGHTIRVGHFSVNSISAEGNARIGCHFLTWKRISEWAEFEGIGSIEVSTEALDDSAKV